MYLAPRTLAVRGPGRALLQRRMARWRGRTEAAPCCAHRCAPPPLALIRTMHPAPQCAQKGGWPHAQGGKGSDHPRSARCSRGSPEVGRGLTFHGQSEHPTVPTQPNPNISPPPQHLQPIHTHFLQRKGRSWSFSPHSCAHSHTTTHTHQLLH
jgi:hypothetical protein